MKNQMKIFNILLVANVCAAILLAINTLVIFSFNTGIWNGFEHIAGKILIMITLFLLSITSATLSYFRTNSIAIENYANGKDSFIANVSHEIKTPVNAIIGLVHLLQNSGLSENQQKIATKINASSDLLLNIINDVLDFSKISTGKLTFYNAPVSLREIMSSIENTFQSLISSKNLSYETDCDFDEDLCLNIDRMRLTQVLLNLVSNAVKFTDSGYIRVSVEVVNEGQHFIQLRFCVRDTGFGINPKEVPLLFREFVQLENYLTKQHQGTGLGLAICRYIVEYMGGKIWVQSVQNEGSEFYFTIYAEKSDSCIAATTSAGPVLTLNGRGAHVLVVEDVEINYEVVESLLQEVNIICDYAPNGLEAIAKCKAHIDDDYYKVILMDIHMPTMDGYKASNILKREMHISTPILALTATSIDPAVAQTYSDIWDGFVLKPFKYTDLYNALMPYFPGTQPPCDRSLGISNLGGSEKLFLKHFERFRQNYINGANDIEAFLNAGQKGEAFRLAHSIKGLAGTLGLSPLQASADALEAAISADSENIPILLQDFRLNLAEVIEVQK